MRPIDVAVDSSLCQALTCAELRFPKNLRMSKAAADLTVCLRFALLGVGAAHFVMKGLPIAEKITITPELRHFGTMIRQQLEQERISPSAHAISEHCPSNAQEVFYQVFDRYIAIARLNTPIDLALSILVDEFVQSHSDELTKRFFFLKSRSQQKLLDVEAQKTLRFTLNFIERRVFDLEELSEIALIGE